MTRRTPQKRRPGRPPAGHVPVLVALRPDQRDALVALAEERRKPGERLPISAVVRDLIDAWMQAERASMGAKRKRDAIEKALDDASRVASEALAGLLNDPPTP